MLRLLLRPCCPCVIESIGSRSRSTGSPHKGQITLSIEDEILQVGPRNSYGVFGRIRIEFAEYCRPGHFIEAALASNLSGVSIITLFHPHSDAIDPETLAELRGTMSWFRMQEQLMRLTALAVQSYVSRRSSWRAWSQAADSYLFHQHWSSPALEVPSTVAPYKFYCWR